jgi:transposase
MKRTIKFVGLDVHQATTVASVREESGRVIARAVLATEASALLEFFSGLRGSVHVAFEEGTQAQWLYELLIRRVGRVVVCDRRGDRRQGNRGDFQDADHLSEQLRLGALRAVYHGGIRRAALKEYSRSYRNLVEDSSRTMQRLKALFRARALACTGKQIYTPEQRSQWLAKLPDVATRFRAQALYTQLDLALELRQKAHDAMIAEARKDPAWKVLRSIPFLGPVRVAQLLAVLQTPWRFRTKKNLWAYAGLAVVTHITAEFALVEGRPVRRKRAPMTRGLNRNFNRVIKDIFKAAATAARSRPGALQDFYHGMLTRGMKEELATVTLARKIAAVTLRLWKKGERYDPAKLTMQAD